MTDDARKPCQACEDAAKICEKRAENRFEEHGYTEPDTNASYYTGRYKDLGDSLDEEDQDCADRIRSSCRHAQPAASAEDARRYAMLFRPTWRNGKGVGVFSYTGYPASPRRISIQEANEHLDAIGDHHD